MRNGNVAIESHLPFARVEQVGSTSVDGAITKGDIDLYVGVPAGKDAEVVTLNHRPDSKIGGGLIIRNRR